MDHDVLNDEEDFTLPNQLIKTMKCENDWDCTFGLYCNGELCACPRGCDYITAFESCDCGEIVHDETPYLPIIVGVVCGFFIVAGWSLVIGVLISSHVKKKRRKLKDHENQQDISRRHNILNPQVTLMTTIDTASPSGQLNGVQNHTTNTKQNNLSKSSSFNRHNQHCPHKRSLRSQSRSPTPRRFDKNHKSHSRSPTPQRNNSPHKSHSHSPTPNRTTGPQPTCKKHLSPFASGSTEPQPSIHRRHSFNPNSTTQNNDYFAATPRRHSLHPSIINTQKNWTDSVAHSQSSVRDMNNHTSRHKFKINSSHKRPRITANVPQILQENIPKNNQLPSVEHIYEQLPGESENCTPLPYNLHPIIEIPVITQNTSSSVNNMLLPSAPVIQLNSQGLHNPPYPTHSTFSQIPLPPNTPPPPYLEDNPLSENNIQPL